MTSRQEFTQCLWENLRQKEYAWLNPGVNLQNENAVPEILIPSQSIQKLLTALRHTSGVGACRASFRFQNTLAVFSSGEWSYSVNFIHKMVSKNLFFLAEDEVPGP